MMFQSNSNERLVRDVSVTYKLSQSVFPLKLI